MDEKEFLEQYAEELNNRVRELITKLSEKGWRVEFSNDGHYRAVNSTGLIVTREGCRLMGVSDECVARDLKFLLGLLKTTKG